ncbi:COG4315 family predicted lipoprotein [Nocardiopsis oceani]
MDRRVKGVVGMAMAASLLATSCSNDPDPPPEEGGQYDDGSETGGYGEATSGESHDDHDDSAGGQAELDTVDNASLGEVLTDGDGNVLYLFTDDGPNESTCFDDCADNWPPVRTVADADIPAELADTLSGDLLGSISRDDGDPQVTYGDWPLYTYAGDAAPGDVNGQGVGSAWFVLAADGRMVTITAAVPEGSGDGNGNGDNTDENREEDGEQDDGGYGGDYRQHPFGG